MFQVALTAVMTSVIMVLLIFLMFMKMKKRKRLAKKINPSILYSVEKEKINLSETKLEPLSAKGILFFIYIDKVVGSKYVPILKTA